MIAIEYKGLQASWSSKSKIWASTDDVFASILNDHLPDEDEIPASIAFRDGGLDKLVLDEIKKLLGKLLKVVAFHPTPAPAEEEGVDF